MRVIADSHRHGFSDYVAVDSNTHVFGREIVAAQVDMARVVDLELCAGQCHIHHAKIVHGSNPNTSAKRRCGYTMRYMPAVTKMRHTQSHAEQLPRGRVMEVAPHATTAEIIRGPALSPDGTTNLMGGLRTSMAKCGYTDVKDFQRAAVAVIAL